MAIISGFDRSVEALVKFSLDILIGATRDEDPNGMVTSP